MQPVLNTKDSDRLIFLVNAVIRALPPALFLIGMMLCLPRTLLGQENTPQQSANRVPIEMGEGASANTLNIDADIREVTWNDVDDSQLIELLTQRLQGQRQSAMLEVWRRRDSLRGVVQRLQQGDDPEARARAIWILDQWGRGALPKTEQEVIRSLSQMPNRRSLQSLLVQGDFQSVIVALEESDGRVEGQAIRDRLAADLVNGFPAYAKLAYEQQQVEKLLRVVDLVANTLELAVCRFGLMQELGLAITEENLLPSSAVRWTPLLTLQAKCTLLFLQGNVEEASRLASQSIDSDLLLRIQMVAGDWEGIAQRLAADAQNTTKGGLDHARNWAQVFAAAERSMTARDSPARIWNLRQEAIKNLLSEPLQDTVEGKLAAAIRWKVLASHGELDQALQILRQLNRSDAAGLCKDAARISEAFDVLGYPLSQVDLQLEQWLVESIEEQRNWNLRDLSPKLREMLTLMQCLIAIGSNQLALEIASELSASDVRVGTLPLREFVVSTLSLTKKRDWMVDFAVPSDATTVSPETYNTVARGLTDCDRLTLQATVEALRGARPSDSSSQHFRDAVSLFTESESSGISLPEQHFSELFSFLLSGKSSKAVNQNPRAIQSSPLNLNFVKLFQRHGKSRYADICLMQLIRQGNDDAVLLKAEQELDSGNAKLAEDLFMQPRMTSSNSRVGTPRLGRQTDRHLGIRSQIGLWRIAKLNQDELTASKRLKAIRYALCTPNLSARNELAEYLSELEESELAVEIFELLLPVVALGDRGKLSLYDVARRYSPLIKGQRPADAARWFDLALQQTLWKVDFRSGAYVSLPMFVNRWALESEIVQGDSNRVNLRLDRMLKLDAMDIDIAERLLPMMRDQGMEQDANRVLDHIIELGLSHSAKFPFDAMTSNNIAWIAAVNKRRLPDALTLSRVAVRAEPDSAIYRDTLAEVLFQLDRPTEAAQIEKGCLIDDPTQWHLHQQYEKYQAKQSSN